LFKLYSYPVNHTNPQNPSSDIGLVGFSEVVFEQSNNVLFKLNSNPINHLNPQNPSSDLEKSMN
jgi:hypothetical protein